MAGCTAPLGLGRRRQSGSARCWPAVWCRQAAPTPGPGGWAFVIVLDGRVVMEKSGSMKETTNNQMELSAAIQGLLYFNEHIQLKEVHLFTDSKYVIDGINSWIHGWKKNNWKTSTKKPVKNEELWRSLDELNSKLTVNWNWIKGHSGDIFNDKVDLLANNATVGDCV